MTNDIAFPPEPEREEPSQARSPRRVLRRIGLTLLALLGLLVVLALGAYQFGSMEPPSAEVRARYDALVAAGKAPPAPNGFHVPIPGCRCHSSDPVLQVQHATIPIRQCSSCHGGGRAQAAR
ncbi:MAG TPA: hypothetical protein VGK50_04850 [Coriobacteriia bacterium]|jgi:hypothetical protein